MFKLWVWSSEVIFFTQVPFLLHPDLVKVRSNLVLLIARYLLSLVLLLWFVTDLPWVVLLVAAWLNLAIYNRQIRRFNKKPIDKEVTLRLIEFIAYFSLVNFVFAIPFYVIKDRKVSLVLHTLINLVGIGVVIYNAVRKQLLDGWSCYSQEFYPSIDDYVLGVCPKLSDYTAPICGHVGIHCDDRRSTAEGDLFHQIGVTLVVASGTLYIFGCPFF